MNAQMRQIDIEPRWKIGLVGDLRCTISFSLVYVWVFCSVSRNVEELAVSPLHRHRHGATWFYIPQKR